MPRKFVPRTLEQSEQALGEVDSIALRAAYDHGNRRCESHPPLFAPLTKPRPGDWLASHEELGQSFPQYAKRMNQKSGFSLPRPACDGLLICTFGASFDSAIGRLFMPHLIKYCTAFFGGMHVDVCDKPFSLNDVQCRENDFGHKQYLIGDIFDMLNTDKTVLSKRRAYCRLAVTLEDIYPGGEWNYVFGQARPMERVGVFSFARHSPLFYDGVHATQAESKLTSESMLSWLKTCRHTMVHETCHMLGILHCVFWHCLMNGNNGPHDSNGSTGFLCPVCLRKLSYVLSGLRGPESVQSIDERYQQLEAVLLELATKVGAESCEASCLGEDLRWLELRRSQLQEALQCPPPPVPVEAPRPRGAPGVSTARIAARRQTASEAAPAPRSREGLRPAGRDRG